MPPKNDLWQHFVKNSDKTATCRHCWKILKTSGNTSNLKCHMESRHEHLMKKPTQSQSTEITNKRSFTECQQDDNNSNIDSCLLDQPCTSKKPKLFIKSGEKDEPLKIAAKNSPITFKDQSKLQSTITQAFSKVESFKEGGGTNEKITQSLIYMIRKD